MTLYLTLLAVLGAGCYALAEVRYDTPIYSDNGMPWRGREGFRDLCPKTSNTTYAYALDFKYDDLNDLDNIGGNGVKFYCRDNKGATVGYVSSLEGKRGEWQGIRSCPKDEQFKGFRLRVFPDQGTWGDDFAVDNIQLKCGNGTIVDGLEGVLPKTKEEEEVEVDKSVIRKWVEEAGRKVEIIRQRIDKKRIHGAWGSWAYCSPDMFVTGLITVVQEGHIEDDAGLTDVIIYCA